MSFRYITPVGAFVDASVLTSGRRVHDIPELMTMIVENCSWKGLTGLAYSSRYLRYLALRQLRSRVRFFLGEFIDDKHINTFFNILHSTDSAIIGGVVRCIITVHRFDVMKVSPPTQLNIVVPFTTPGNKDARGFRVWRRFLSFIGYTELVGPLDPPYHMLSAAGKWSIFTKERGFSSLKISLLESKSLSVIPPILNNAHTSNFMLLNSTRIICYYPALLSLRKNINIKGYSSGRKCVFDSYNYDLTHFPTTNSWGGFSGTCGEVCPMLFRSTSNHENAGVLRWGGISGDFDKGGDGNPMSLESRGTQSDWMWRPTGDCVNHFCPHYDKCMDILSRL